MATKDREHVEDYGINCIIYVIMWVMITYIDRCLALFRSNESNEEQILFNDSVCSSMKHASNFDLKYGHLVPVIVSNKNDPIISAYFVNPSVTK